MKTPTLTLPSILAFATTATASSQLIKNYCSHTMYLTLTDASGAVDGPFDLPSSQAYINDIVGTGNICKVTLDPDIFAADTAGFTLGTSTDMGILYWSVGHGDNGDPFEDMAWNVTSTGSTDGVCSSTTTYDEQVHACQDQDVTLILNLC